MASNGKVLVWYNRNMSVWDIRTGVRIYRNRIFSDHSITVHGGIDDNYFYNFTVREGSPMRMQRMILSNFKPKPRSYKSGSF